MYTVVITILAIAALRNLEVHQMNVKIEFLNRDLHGEIYMEQLRVSLLLGKRKMFASWLGHYMV